MDTSYKVNSFFCPGQTFIWKWFTTPFTVGETVSSQRLHLHGLRLIVSQNTWWQKDLQFLFRATSTGIGVGWHYFKKGAHFKMNWVLTMTSAEIPGLKSLSHNLFW